MLQVGATGKKEKESSYDAALRKYSFLMPSKLNVPG
jgi:hypothetical protein